MTASCTGLRSALRARQCRGQREIAATKGAGDNGPASKHRRFSQNWAPDICAEFNAKGCKYAPCLRCATTVNTRPSSFQGSSDHLGSTQAAENRGPSSDPPFQHCCQFHLHRPRTGCSSLSRAHDEATAALDVRVRKFTHVSSCSAV